MFLRRLLAALAGVGASMAGISVSEHDSLTSRRLAKRFVDDAGHYNLSFYHINDVHAHLDQFAASGSDCKHPEAGCFGGYSRVKTVLDAGRPQHRDSLLLNAGDEFQGTLFFTYYGGDKIADTLNQLGFDAMTLGNHEFDRGDDFLGDFLGNLTFPVVSANVVSDHPVLNRTVQPFHVFDDYGLAVIGVTTESTADISNPGAGTSFTDAIQAVQDTVHLIRATTNVSRIAALTHIGYDQDQKLAEQTTGLHLIIGGHSHTPLGDFPGARGPYPTVVENRDGDEVFVVTAYRWGEYLGYIDVTFDADGKVLAYHGGPIHLTNATEQDADLQAQVDAWKEPLQQFTRETIGESKVVLDQTTCQKKECLLGDLMADAILAYRNSSDVAFALVNAGGIRSTIDDGNITRGDVLTAFPFGNAVVDLSLSGARLWDTLEGIASRVNVDNGRPVTSFVQVSKGVRIEYAPGDGDAKGRLVSVHIRGKPLDRKAHYKLATVDYLAGGGDNFFSPPFNGLASLDALDEVLTRYIQAESPVDIQLDGRIVDSSSRAGPPGSSPTGSGASFLDASNMVVAFSMAMIMGI